MTLPSAPRRVLVIQLRRFGDVVLTTALFEDLRRAFPSVPIDFLVGAAAAPMLEHHPLISERIVYDQEHALRMWREIRARHYDWIIDVQSSPRTAPLTLVSGAKKRVGWDVKGWGWVYTHRLPRGGRAHEYVVRQRQRLLELLGVSVHRSRPRLYITGAERELGELDLANAGVPRGSLRVGMLLSTAKSANAWNVAGFADVAHALSAEGVTPVIFSTRGDAALVLEMQRSAPRSVVMPEMEIRRFLGALAGCHVFVSGDTGPAHMAAALDVPTVTIFGATSPVLWNAGLPTTVVVRDTNVPCLECQHDDCPIGHDCMHGVTAAAVLTRVRELLGRPEVIQLSRR
ncbi:MAG: glycosyltransferase family 9 protein [Gemmatimonadota bacterium]|nr:glycosyltransferase family 9 protein [Gemmatimonadota bacterium]